MAVESKPLFHPEVIRQHLRSFTLPASVEESLPKLKHWADRINSGEADKLKETALLPDFLTDTFVAEVKRIRGGKLPLTAAGLTPDEIDLMWKTAPPRMPITKPYPKP